MLQPSMHEGQKAEEHGHTGGGTLEHLHDCFLTGILVGEMEQFITECLEKDHAQWWMMLFAYFLRCGGRGTDIVTCASFNAPTSDLILI